MEDKSTPRPWSVQEDRHEICIVADELGSGDVVCSMHYAETDHADCDRANAALIVSAVNSHAAMKECVEALKDFVAVAELSEPGVNINFAIALRKTKAKAALARLEKANG